MLKALRQQPNQQVRDRVVIYDVDMGTCEILWVDEQDEEVIKAGNKVIPRADVAPALSKQGRVYTFQARTHIIEKTQHLAQVEKNMIIRQIAQYKRPEEAESKTNWMNYILIASLVVVSIVAAAGGN